MRVAVAGLGKLGLPLATVLANAGHWVVGADRSQKIVDCVNRGEAPFEEWGLQEAIQSAGSSLKATTNTTEAVAASEVTFILVPTPSDETGQFSNEYVLQACDEIGAALKEQPNWHLVVVSSTVMPGSTNGVIRERLEAVSGKKVGPGFGLVYSPEFIALGSVIQDMKRPDMVLIGASDARSAETMERLAFTWLEDEATPVHRLSLVDAEIAKISVNAYVTMKISYANTLAAICEGVPGASASSVLNAVGSDRRVGGRYLQPATSFSGPCFPRDSKAFAVFAEDVGANSALPRATDNVNVDQITRLIDKVHDHAKDQSVSILGLSYKAGTPVWEESAGVTLAMELRRVGWTVSVYDPMARPWNDLLGNPPHVAGSAEECISQSSLVVVCTPWHEFRKVDYSKKTVIDCWGIVRSAKKLVRIGEGC